MARSSLLVLFLQVLLVLAFASLPASASKQDLSDIVDRHHQSFHHDARSLQITGTEGEDDATAAEGDDTAAGDDDDSVHLGTDDAAYNATKPGLLPPENEQPASWPTTILIIFLVLAAGLLGVTGVKNCRKRREYEDVPTTSLVV